MSDNYDDDRCPACWCRACMCCERDATLLHDPHERPEDDRELDRAQDLRATGADFAQEQRGRDIEEHTSTRQGYPL